MKSYHHKFVSDHPLESTPMAEIDGFPVRPGIFDLNGATPLQNGVNFTIHTCGGTSCELLTPFSGSDLYSIQFQVSAYGLLAYI